MYLTAVVASIQQFKMWGQRSEKHQQAESKYGELGKYKFLSKFVTLTFIRA